MTNALLAQFIPEARELLEHAGSGLLALEKSQSAEALDDIFRAVHTLKGTSGLFDIAPLTNLVHAAEDLLVEVRAGKLTLESEIVDGLLDSLDLVGHWIDALESREVLPDDAEAAMAGRVETLRGWLEAGGPAASVDTVGRQAAPDWLGSLPEAERQAAYAAGAPLVAWSYEPDESCFFRGDDPAHLVAQAPGLLGLRVVPRGPVPPLEAYDPVLSWLRFEALCAAPLEAVSEHLRYASDQVQLSPIEPEDLIVLAGPEDAAEMFGDFGVRARALVATGARAELKAAAAALLGIIGSATRQAAALRWIAALAATADAGALLRLVSAIDGATPVPTPASPPAAALQAPAGAAPSRTSAGAESPLRQRAEAILAVQAEMLAVTAEEALNAGRLAAARTVVRRCLPHLAPARAEALKAALARPGDTAALFALLRPADDAVPTAAPAATPTAVASPAAPAPALSAAESPDGGDGKGAGAGPARMLRVDQAKVDTLMNFAAELVVAKNGLAYLAGRVEQVSGSRQLGREIKEQYAVIDRIAQSLQVGVMAIRMMPVSQVFQRFPRLVRDTTRKLGKEVELVIQGEDTEADKNVLESLADPLIHMVRNALDHGIETPADRVAVGKPARGTLRLSARQENDNVIIEVADDGKGIDPEVVRDKALRVGLITPDQAAQMAPEEFVNLVFAPGFSTREQVSDLSGRGVGMDVVRNAVRKAGGDVWLASRLGQGSCVTVQLPLTMAVTRIVTVEASGQQYGVAMDAVAETVKVPRGQIHRIKQRETFVLRDAVIPLVRLADSLGLAPAAGAPPDEEAVMVARVGRERVGIVVDGFRERMEVIVRPLDGLLAGLVGFSGTALLGDGRVLLVLNLPDLI
ncbi:two-component system, chemotaxis family, sensor kinase CheA [Methylobacterium phyllostachyos]|uniref:Chemotaxis protein CheA n=1 Tax=Methylobacterium phyllostachyos TaxID=582672 RepID=A0A1G9YE34_9HYPH|nr:chemotaxis protein CheA [Methylobacterium phyllostachyos]SDN06673.1 two-component system, chemotaxis family, sensor kinase CheA [Methylobacterium phyllostachyos]